MDLEKISLELKKITYAAGEILLKYMHKEKKIQHKSDINLLTNADQESEQFVVESLKNSFKDFGIIAEEGTAYESQNGYKWLIDPLDGTTSFAHDFPMFAVSIALTDENNEPILGMVYNPFFNELFHGIKGKGAFLNEKPIRVSQTSSINRALLGTGFPYDRRNRMDTLLKRLGNFLHEIQDIRRTGSSAIDICFVACGRLDGYYEEGLQAWDTAAALIIAKEAGGKATKFDNSKIDIFYPQMVVSNGFIHNDILKILDSS